MNTLAIKIRKTPAPVKLVRRSKSSAYRDLFEQMSAGNWFYVPKADYHKLQNAGQLYMKGNYSLYKHPRRPNTFVFKRLK